jgi:hypothetical protein
MAFLFRKNYSQFGVPQVQRYTKKTTLLTPHAEEGLRSRGACTHHSSIKNQLLIIFRHEGAIVAQLTVLL